MNEALVYQGVIDDQIDFIDTPASKYQIGPLIISVGKGWDRSTSNQTKIISFRFRFIRKNETSARPWSQSE